MYLVFKTTYIDRGKPLREGAFFFTRTMLFPPLNKRNTRDKAKGFSDHFGEAYRGKLGMLCLSTLNRGQHSPATVSYCLSRLEEMVVAPLSNESPRLEFGF